MSGEWLWWCTGRTRRSRPVWCRQNKLLGLRGGLGRDTRVGSGQWAGGGQRAVYKEYWFKFIDSALRAGMSQRPCSQFLAPSAAHSHSHPCPALPVPSVPRPHRHARDCPGPVRLGHPARLQPQLPIFASPSAFDISQNKRETTLRKKTLLASPSPKARCHSQTTTIPVSMTRLVAIKSSSTPWAAADQAEPPPPPATLVN